MPNLPTRRNTLGWIASAGGTASATAVLAGLSASAQAPAAGQPRGLLSPSLKGLPDYSFAGFGHGIVALPVDPGTVINVAAFGAKGDGRSDDTSAVLGAIAAAEQVKGKVTVRFPPGQYNISSVLRIQRSDFVLEGAGKDDRGTTLFFPRPLRLIDESDDLRELREYIRKENKRQIETETNINYWFSEYSWSEGLIRVGIPGTRYAEYLPDYDVKPDIITPGVNGVRWGRQLDVADASQIRPGQIIQIQWYADRGVDSGIIRSLYGETDLRIGQRHYDNPARALVVQSTRVRAVKANRLLLGDPLLHAVSSGQPARLVRKSFLTGVGIQGLRIAFPDAPSFGHHLEQGYNAIALNEMFDGWVRDVAIDNADSGILTYDSACLTVSRVTTTGDRGGHYAVHVGNAHNVLVKDLLVANTVVHPLTVNTQSTRTVYTQATVLKNGHIDQHAGANHENLFDAVRLHVRPKLENGRWVHDTWAGSGASYWKPNHGLHNTTWNLDVVVDGGAPWDADVTLRGLNQGVGENVVGVSGNRRFSVIYDRAARIDGVNAERLNPHSLYEHQLNARAGSAQTD